MPSLENTSWTAYRDALWLEARRTRTPIMGTFELTPLCNFRCRMCYVRLDPSEVSSHGRLHTADEWVDLARQAMDAGTYRITLTGGEVLTRPDFQEIYARLFDMGLLVSVLSNGSLVDDEIVDLFRRRPPTNLRFTLYGASNETYQRLCGAQDGFDRVMESLRSLKRANVGFSLAFTETTENVDDTKAAYEIARSLDVGIALSTEVVPSVRGARGEGDSLRVCLDDIPMPTMTAREKDVPAERPIIEKNPELFDGAFARCRMYGTSFWVDWNGYMENCAFMSSCRATPFESGFAAAWEDLQTKLARIAIPVTCRACADVDQCEICPEVREARTGRPDGVPLEACSDVRERTSGLHPRLS